MGRVSRDYVDGYREGFGPQRYDPDRFAESDYRAGMQDGRTHRIDDELTARYGGPDDPRPPQAGR